MFTKKNTEPTPLDEAIASALTDLSGYTAETEEYQAILTQLVKLYELQPERKLRWENIDPNVLVTSGTSLLGIIAILKFEKYDVIASKALGFVKKLV